MQGVSRDGRLGNSISFLGPMELDRARAQWSVISTPKIYPAVHHRIRNTSHSFHHTTSLPFPLLLKNGQADRD